MKSVRSEGDNDEIDRAIALSLADEEHKKGKAIGLYFSLPEY
jgi:hypothetical protein